MAAAASDPATSGETPANLVNNFGKSALITSHTPTSLPPPQQERRGLQPAQYRRSVAPPSLKVWLPHESQSHANFASNGFFLLSLFAWDKMDCGDFTIDVDYEYRRRCRYYPYVNCSWPELPYETFFQQDNCPVYSKVRKEGGGGATAAKYAGAGVGGFAAAAVLVAIIIMVRRRHRRSIQAALARAEEAFNRHGAYRRAENESAASTMQGGARRRQERYAEPAPSPAAGPARSVAAPLRHMGAGAPSGGGGGGGGDPRPGYPHGYVERGLLNPVYTNNRGAAHHWTTAPAAAAAPGASEWCNVGLDDSGGSRKNVKKSKARKEGRGRQ